MTRLKTDESNHVKVYLLKEDVIAILREEEISKDGEEMLKTALRTFLYNEREKIRLKRDIEADAEEEEE